MSNLGRAKVVLVLLALAACGGMLIVAWLLRGTSAVAPPRTDVQRALEHGEDARDLPDPGTGTALARGTSGEPGAERLASAAPASIGAEKPPAPESAARDRNRRGTIRGEILVRDGASFPESWSLVVGPHPWLEGHESAESRRVEFVHGEKTFELQDLPLGGYLVEAQAPGLNCMPGNVLLVRGSEAQYVTVLLLPSGTIDGGVLEASGVPAEGLEVTLESTRTAERRTLATDAAGIFVFRDVLDGEYRLSFGRPDSPLLPVESLAFKSPSMRFPTRSLPPLGTLSIRVVDAAHHAIPRAEITGSAPGGSAVEARGDEFGLTRVPYLLPGRYRIDARTETGFEGSAAIDVAAGKDATLELVLRDRRERRE